MSTVRTQVAITNAAHTNKQFQPINPKPFLKTLVDKPVIVRLKWNQLLYKGTLVAIDNYMNLQLEDTSEIVGGASSEADSKDSDTRAEKIGDIFIRCNNVLYVREALAA